MYVFISDQTTHWFLAIEGHLVVLDKNYFDINLNQPNFTTFVYRVIIIMNQKI